MPACVYCGWPGAGTYVGIKAERPYAYLEPNAPVGRPSGLCSVCDEMWRAIFEQPGLRRAHYEEMQRIDIAKIEKRRIMGDY